MRINAKVVTVGSVLTIVGLIMVCIFIDRNTAGNMLSDMV